MPDSIVRTVQCAYCLRHSVNVTYEAGLNDDGNRVEREVAGEVLDRRLHRSEAAAAVNQPSDRLYVTRRVLTRRH